MAKAATKKKTAKKNSKHPVKKKAAYARSHAPRPSARYHFEEKPTTKRSKAEKKEAFVFVEGVVQLTRENRIMFALFKNEGYESIESVIAEAKEKYPKLSAQDAYVKFFQVVFKKSLAEASEKRAAYYEENPELLEDLDEQCEPT
jgi:hypothetical protein